MGHVTRVNRELKYKGSIVDVYSDEMLLSNGKREYWDYIEHRKGAAAVLPVLDDGRIVMVKQYRNALERFTLEIPAGSRDDVEEPMIVCAKRELEEETGYCCDTMTSLLNLRTTVAFCNEQIEVFLAEHLTQGHQNLDEGEEIEICYFDYEELRDKVFKGEIQDSKTVAAIMAYGNIKE